jgi:hypothetical protein
MQQLERFIDVLELHVVGDILVEQCVSRHVLVHKPWNVSPALVATKRSACPLPPRHQLKWSRLQINTRAFRAL